MKFIHMAVSIGCVAGILSLSSRSINEWQYWAICLLLLLLGINIIFDVYNN